MYDLAFDEISVELSSGLDISVAHQLSAVS